MKRSSIPLAFLALIAACGSSHSAAHPDSTVGMDVEAAPPQAIVVAGDYVPGHPGVVSAVDVIARTITRGIAPEGAAGDDPMLRQYGSELFVVNRSDGNNVTILDAGTHALVEQLATGAGSNPQDVAVQGNNLYVPVYGGKGVAVLTRGMTTIGTIDFSADDPDGKPNCVSAYFVGDQLYVACELLDDTASPPAPRGPGKVYVFNPGTEQLMNIVTMQNKNPFGVFTQLPSGDLAIPTVDFSNNTGCVEKITTGASPASGGCIVTNTQLHGYAAGLAVQANVMLLSVSGFDFMHPSSNLQGYDLGTNDLWPAPISPTTELVTALATCPNGDIVVTDAASQGGGIRIYSGAAEVTTAPLAVGLATANANALACY
jgi:hypothetical protein